MNDARVRPRSNRLFFYDRRIVINEARATFQTWHDRLIAAGILLVGLAIVRSALAAQHWPTLFWIGLGVGALAGLGAGRLLAARLRFHGFDGPFAPDAIRPSGRRRYLLAWHAIGLGMATALTLVARPSILVVTLPGYFLGAVAGHVLHGLNWTFAATGESRLGRDLRARARRPIAGIAAAALLLVSLALVGKAVPVNALAAIAATITLGCLVILTTVDARVIAFMRISGYKPWHIVGLHARGAALFAVIAVPICWLGFDEIVAATVAVLSSGALLLLSIRILAYQLHRKRAADFMFSILTALLVLTALVLPPALPVVAMAVLWELQRRAKTKAWLIA